MQNVSEEMWLTWELGEFVGDNRPVTRAIISKQTLRTSQEVFRTLLHEASVDNIEIPYSKQGYTLHLPGSMPIATVIFLSGSALDTTKRIAEFFNKGVE